MHSCDARDRSAANNSMPTVRTTVVWLLWPSAGIGTNACTQAPAANGRCRKTHEQHTQTTRAWTSRDNKLTAGSGTAAAAFDDPSGATPAVAADASTSPI